jgi:hypothetical protein
VSSSKSKLLVWACPAVALMASNTTKMASMSIMLIYFRPDQLHERKQLTAPAYCTNLNRQC